MPLDLAHEELVYLMQLVNADFCEKQRRTGQETPFEATVFAKLSASQDETRSEATPR